MAVDQEHGRGDIGFGEGQAGLADPALAPQPLGMSSHQRLRQVEPQRTEAAPAVDHQGAPLAADHGVYRREARRGVHLHWHGRPLRKRGARRVEAERARAVVQRHALALEQPPEDDRSQRQRPDHGLHQPAPSLRLLRGVGALLAQRGRAALGWEVELEVQHLALGLKLCGGQWRSQRSRCAYGSACPRRLRGRGRARRTASVRRSPGSRRRASAAPSRPRRSASSARTSGCRPG